MKGTLHIDIAKFFFCIVAVVLAALGIVSWWVLLLFALYSIKVEWSFSF